MKNLISSISYDQGEIINNILRLHVPSHKIDCDPTYSKGNFYKKYNVPEPQLKFDISPCLPEVVQADCRHLPIKNDSIDCLMFDPPFLATKGPSLSKDDDNNKINKRFGVYPTERELFQFYTDSLVEFHRVLKDNGVLIFKCQDKVSSGKQYMSHVFVVNRPVS